MIIKKHVRRIASIVMASVMLMSVTSCNLRAFRSKIISDPITPQELARLMITAINNKKNAPDVYSSIPEVQRDGLSYSYFIQYVDIMSRISGENGDISAFRIRIRRCRSRIYNHVRGQFGNGISFRGMDHGIDRYI